MMLLGWSFIVTALITAAYGVGYARGRRVAMREASRILLEAMPLDCHWRH